MTKRNLTGLYFRSRDPDTDRVVNLCFEELSKDQRDAILATNDEKFKDRMINRLVDVINEIGNTTDLIRDEE